MPNNPSPAKGGQTVSAVWELAQPLAQQLELRLWDVRFEKEGANWYLRIFIDKDGGVQISDCEAMSHALDAPLDEADLIAQSYHLQVSSPGVERNLRRPEHFAQFLGEKIFLRLIRPQDNCRDFKGVLSAYDKGVLLLLLEDGKTLTVNQKETSYIRLDDFGGF